MNTSTVPFFLKVTLLCPKNDTLKATQKLITDTVSSKYLHTASLTASTEQSAPTKPARARTQELKPSHNLKHKNGNSQIHESCQSANNKKSDNSQEFTVFQQSENSGISARNNTHPYSPYSIQLLIVYVIFGSQIYFPFHLSVLHAGLHVTVNVLQNVYRSVLYLDEDA